MTATLHLSALRGRLSVADQPTALLSDLFLLRCAQLLHDVLGAEATGVWVRLARHHAHALLDGPLAEQGEAAGPRLQLARSLFAWAGEGRFAIEADAGRRRAVGLPLLESHTGGRYGLTTGEPADGWAAGWIGGAFEGVLQRPPHSLSVRQTACRSLGDARCEFDFVRALPVEPVASLTDEEISTYRIEALDDGDEDRQALATSYFEQLWGEAPDRLGLRPAGGHFWALRPIDAYVAAMEQAFDAVAAQEDLHAMVLAEVARDAARAEVLQAWLGVLQDVGPLERPAILLQQLCGLAGALGRGRWRVAEWIPGERLRLVADQLPELDAIVAGRAAPLGCWMLQGAALAMFDGLQVGWDAAVRPEGRTGRVHVAQCPSLGDDFAVIEVRAG